jgi:hypothetical protein
MGFPYVLAGGGYSTGALAQTMSDGEPISRRWFLRYRTKMFHVKRFGTIDTLRKHTFARRGKIRSQDLEQAENCDRFKLYSVRFFKKCLSGCGKFSRI